MEDNYSRPRRRKKKKQSKLKVALKMLGGLLILVLITLIIGVGTLYLTLFKIKNSSEAARNLLITTLMESGQLKFVAHIGDDDLTTILFGILQHMF